jgi:hypothetical protein
MIILLFFLGQGLRNVYLIVLSPCSDQTIVAFKMFHLNSLLFDFLSCL